MSLHPSKAALCLASGHEHFAGWHAKSLLNLAFWQSSKTVVMLRASEAAGRAHVALQRGTGREVKRMEATARVAAKAAHQAEEKAAYPAAHATAHQEVATGQADLADQVRCSALTRDLYLPTIQCLDIPYTELECPRMIVQDGHNPGS